MSRSLSAPLLGPEFDDFLFAPLGEERNGMRLSVISAPARLEVDPWQEAASLAELPGKVATERLASLITLMPDELSPHRDPDVIAARLVALLPRRASSNIALRQTLLGTEKVTHPWGVIYVIWIVIALSAQWIVASRQLATQYDKTPAPVSATISRQTPPSLGQ
jgi:hypothetical protein